MSGDSPCWKIEGDEALLECGPLQAGIRLNRLDVGLENVRWRVKAHGGTPDFSAMKLFCGDKDPGCRRIESYVRGNDLISNYESDSPLGTPQIYWRVRHDVTRSAVGIEVILSKHTSLLDSDPNSSVECHGWILWYADALDPSSFVNVKTKAECIDIDGKSSRIQLFLLRDKRLGLSYLQMVHPSDFATAKIINLFPESDCDLCAVRSRLFPDPLEKGVIRRARIGGWFLPAENDLAVAVELAHQFIDEPLPLTT